jgi:delta-aminolevulinic acid dehydratase/porphobilinogen synthase
LLIQQVNPVTIVLTGLFSLLDDADVSREEADQLLQIVMKQLKQMTTTYQVAMVLIDRTYGEYEMTGFDGLIDTTVQVQDMRNCPRITVIQKNQQITVTSETVGQLCLQDFGMVM